MNGTPIAACSGTFYDSGGSIGNYANNENLNTTICPDGTGASHIVLSFDSLSLSAGDQLCFHDGSSVLAPLLLCSNAIAPGQPFQIKATANNPSGCITLAFTSDAAGTAAGWAAAISCAPPCLFPAPANVQVVSMYNGDMIWTWDNVPGNMGYQVSVNGGPWIPASGALSHTVSGLVSGNLVVIEIQALSGDPNCPPASITANKVYVNCALTATVASLKPALCAGTATGSATITAAGNMGTVQFFVDNNPTPLSNGNLNGMFAAGAHVVIVRDTAGCQDTVSFNITEPLPLSVTVDVTDAECHGDDSGAIQAAASGGTQPYTYAWQGCQGGNIVNDSLAIDLFAGCYSVTVTDKNGCTVVAKDSVGEPPMFEFQSVQDSVSCFGGSDGTATITVKGSKPPYTYLWSNGDTTKVADNLKAGYHAVTITDSVGCKAVTLVQVLEPVKLVIDSISATGLPCFGGNTGTARVTAKGGVKTYSYKWSNSETTQNIANLTAGPYTVTVTDHNGCTAVANTTVNAPPDLTVQLTDVQAETCINACNGSITLSNSGGTAPYTIVWNNPNIPPGSTLAQNLCPGNYQLTVTDANGCSKTNSATILAAVPITIQFSATPPLCAGDQNGTLATTVGGGILPYQFTWNNGAGTPVIQNLACGIYTVTVSDAKGCKIVASDTLDCPGPILLDSLVIYPVRCFGEANGRIHVGAHGGTGLLDYVWSDPNQQLDTVAVNLAPGIYTVTITDGNGCSLSETAAITQPPAMVIALTPTHIPCFGETTGTIQSNVSGGTPPYNYSWNVPQNTPVITNLAAGTYTLTVTDANNCHSMGAQATVNQPATPIQVLTVQTQLACFGAGNGIASAAASGSNGPPFTFAWSNGLSGPAPATFSAGTYTVTATDGSGCTGTGTISIQEREKIEVDVAVIPPTCQGGNNGQAAVNKVTGGAGNGISGNYHYQWSVPGAPDTVYINGLSGDQTYGLTVSDNAGCTETFAFFLEDQVPLVPVLATDSISCAGLDDGGVRIISIQSPRPVTHFEWNTGDTAQTLANLTAGTYTVTVSDNQGCTGSASATVFEPLPLSTALTIKSLVCNVDSNGMIAVAVSGGTPGYSFHWNTGSNLAKLTNLGPGGYAFTVTDKHGCTTADSTYLAQPNPPDIQVESVAPSCFGSSDGSFRLTVTGGTVPYRFSLDGQNYTGSSVFLGLKAGMYTAFVLDGAGCQTNAVIELIQPPKVEVSLGPDTSLVLGDSLLLQPVPTNAVGSISYRWKSTLIDSMRCADPPLCSTFWIYPVYSNAYHVTITDSNGCTAEASIRVELEKPRGVYVPTGFSPNGDGNNERLAVYGKSQQIRKVKMFRIFDRWGELVFEQRDFPVNSDQYGWDGVFRGQNSPAGVYVWYVEVEYLDGFEPTHRGHSTLIR